MNVQTKVNGRVNLNQSYDLTNGDKVIGNIFNAGMGWFIDYNGEFYHASTINRAKQLVEELETLKEEGY